MDFKHKRSLGIIGGMGSHASTWLLQRIIYLSAAPTDQDNLDIIIHNNSYIPDRTAAIIHKASSPIDQLQRSINYLNQCEVEVAVLACMTAHLYHPQLSTIFRGNLLDVSHIVVNEMANDAGYKSFKKVGLIGSTGMLTTGIFQKRLEASGYQVLTLNEADQHTYFMEPLYGKNGIKAGTMDGEIKRIFLRQLDVLRDQGAEMIIGACSEIPLIVNEPLSFPFIDSFDLLARKTVDYCYKRTNL